MADPGDIPTTDDDFFIPPKTQGPKGAGVLGSTADYSKDMLERIRDDLTELKHRRQRGGVYFYRPEPKLNQDQFLRAHASHKIIGLLGGNRSGKTETGSASVVAAAIGKHKYWKPKSRKPIFWVVNVDHNVARRGSLQKVFKHIPQSMVDKYYKVEKILRLKNGAEIEFKSVVNGREHFQAADVDGVWIDEECPEDIYDEIYARTLDRQGKILFTFSPLMGLTWAFDQLYKRAHIRVDGDPAVPMGSDDDIALFHADTRNNPHLNKKELQKWEARMSEEEKQMRLLGRFISLSGHIFGKELQAYNPMVERYVDIPSWWPKFRALDAGTRNPAAGLWGAVDEEGQLWFYDEYEEPGKPTGYHIDQFIQRSGIDYEGTSVVDPSAAQWKLDFATAGIGLEDADNSVDDGILLLKGLLTAKKIKLLPHLLILQRQLKNYQWKAKPRRSVEDPKPAPMKKDDHVLDCARYIAMAARDIVAERPALDADDGFTLEYFENLMREKSSASDCYGTEAWHHAQSEIYGGLA